MPITISRISPQKNKKNRYSLYSDETFIIGISEEVLISFGIFKGCQINDDTLQKIKEEEYLISIRNQGLRFLARRPHSIKQLKDKLIHKDFKRNYIDLIINEFLRQKYLDDNEFSRLFIREEMKIKKNGPLLIKNKLIARGINPEKASVMIGEIYNEKSQNDNCLEIAEKKLKALAKYPDQEKKRKLAVFLKQKGYYWETVQQALQKLIITDAAY